MQKAMLCEDHLDKLQYSVKIDDKGCPPLAKDWQADKGSKVLRIHERRNANIVCRCKKIVEDFQEIYGRAF